MLYPTPSTAMNFSGFTLRFTESIKESSSRIQSWAEVKKKEADTAVIEAKAVENEEQHKIDGLLRQLKSLQYQRGVVSRVNNGTSSDDGGLKEQREKLESKQKRLEEDIALLDTRKKVEQSKLDEVLAEESVYRLKALEIRDKKREIEENKNTTLEDLTRGLLNYRYTGLNFDKDRNGGLIFIFTKIDPNEEAREFTFALNLNENHLYELTACNPKLETSRTDALLSNLNSDRDNGFNSLIVGMRKLFKATL